MYQAFSEWGNYAKMERVSRSITEGYRKKDDASQSNSFENTNV